MTNPTRQELYERIRSSSKDAVILAEMRRLGFWNGDKPSEIPELIERSAELQQQLRKLYQQQAQVQDPQQALRLMRKERMAKAKAQRELTKRQHAETRHQRALAWYEQQQRGMVWLGQDVSAGLNHLSSETERLTARALPVLDTPLVLAEAMGITLNELRFLAYQRQSSKVHHYQYFQIAKKSGGMRDISAPMPRLKRAQYWILDNILQTQSLHPAAHGFVKNRSILTNAKPHVGQALVLNLDLKNFFPSISYPRVKGLFKSLGYSEALATVLALLCTQAEVDELQLDGVDWFVMRGQRHLPQGAPTSPAISNLLARSLDRRLQGIADKYGYSYTRYADDLSFSCAAENRAHLMRLLWAIKATVKDEGFTLHPDKTRIMPQGQQQEVTGLVVNDKLSIDRATLKRFRALLQQIERNGIQGKTWQGISKPRQLMRALQGYANFVAMVLPEKGSRFKAQLKAIQAQQLSELSHQKQRSGVGKAEFRKRSAQGQAPLHPWREVQSLAKPTLELTAVQQAELKKAEKAALKQPTSTPKAHQVIPTPPTQTQTPSLWNWLKGLLR
jgi:retron-type reverse transcriptase